MSDENDPGFVVFASGNGCTEAGHRRIAGTYASRHEAVAKAQQVVEAFLAENHKPGMTARELAGLFRLFGDDVWIDPDESAFSALGYAKKRGRALCSST